MTSQVPSATVAASAAMNSVRMIRFRRAVPLVPYMSIAASRLTFTSAWSHTGPRLRSHDQAGSGIDEWPSQSMIGTPESMRPCLTPVDN